jgi:hypothetical protein
MKGSDAGVSADLESHLLFKCYMTISLSRFPQFPKVADNRSPMGCWGLLRWCLWILAQTHVSCWGHLWVLWLKLGVNFLPCLGRPCWLPLNIHFLPFLFCFCSGKSPALGGQRLPSQNQGQGSNGNSPSMAAKGLGRALRPSSGRKLLGVLEKTLFPLFCLWGFQVFMKHPEL